VKLEALNSGTTLSAGQATVGERFRQARELLIAGDVAAAQGQFEAWMAEGLRQPTLN